jgi:hypothetical protein
MKHKYEIIIYWSDEDRAFVAEVPELSGCAAMAALRRLPSPTAALSYAAHAT